MSQPKCLAARWRVEAEMARSIGADAQAKTLEKCAAELDAYNREATLALVTLREATAISGLSYSALEKAVRSGRIPNAGRKHCPLVRIADLPRKAGTRLRAESGPELAGLVLAHRR